MFCSNCGKENVNDAKFCVACGRPMVNNVTPSAQPVQQGQSYNMPQQPPNMVQPAPQKKSKTRIIVLITLLVLLLVGGTITGVVLFVNHQNELRLAEERAREEEEEEEEEHNPDSYINRSRRSEMIQYGQSLATAIQVALSAEASYNAASHLYNSDTPIAYNDIIHNEDDFASKLLECLGTDEIEVKAKYLSGEGDEVLEVDRDAGFYFVVNASENSIKVYVRVPGATSSDIDGFVMLYPTVDECVQ